MQVIGNNYWSAQIQKKEEGWQDYIVGMLSTHRGFDVSAEPRTFNGIWLDSRILSHFLKFQQREKFESEN